MSSLSEKNGFEWWAVCASKNAFKWTIDGFAAGTLSEEFMKTPEFLKSAQKDQKGSKYKILVLNIVYKHKIYL